jgi:hypothetical protein
MCWLVSASVRAPSSVQLPCLSSSLHLSAILASPCVLSQNTLIFNVGAVEICSQADAEPVVSFTLTADGYASQFGQTTTIGRGDKVERVGSSESFTRAGSGSSFTRAGSTGSVHTFGRTSSSSAGQVFKGFTFALDKTRLETAILTLNVTSGAQVLERKIPVRTLKYSGQRYFSETFSFGMIEGQDKNITPTPTVKLSFELLSIGDGKVHVPKQPYFMDLELARAQAPSVCA